jgi:hypothetical protein
LDEFVKAEVSLFVILFIFIFCCIFALSVDILRKLFFLELYDFFTFKLSKLFEFILELLIFFRSGKIIPFLFSEINLSLTDIYLSKVFLLKRFSYVLIFLLKGELLFQNIFFLFLLLLLSSFSFFNILMLSSIFFILLFCPLSNSLLFVITFFTFSLFLLLFNLILSFLTSFSLFILFFSSSSS